ncbi:MAG: ThiF family adenylyltransferase [Janthinobacterium lividum]
MKLAVIGTGALGSTLLELLAKHAVQSVLLVDPDTLHERNLALSQFLTAAASRSASRHFKAALLAQEARHTYNLPWQAMTCEIADVGWQDLQDVDLICCCTDSALSRIETAFIAHMLAKPVLDGAVFGDGIPAGRISRFSQAPGAACYLCGMGEDSRATVLGSAASAAMGCRVPEDPKQMTGTLATLQQVAQRMLECILHFATSGAWPAESTVWKTALTHGDPEQERPRWQDETIALSRSAGCPWHGPIPGTLVPLPWDKSVREALQAGDRLPELQLAWPICTIAVCSGCGWRGTPLRRVAVVRQSLECPRCGLHDLEPVRALHRIRVTDPESALSPQQLGLPPRHLYWLQDTAV